MTRYTTLTGIIDTHRSSLSPTCLFVLSFFAPAFIAVSVSLSRGTHGSWLSGPRESPKSPWRISDNKTATDVFTPPGGYRLRYFISRDSARAEVARVRPPMKIVFEGFLIYGRDKILSST